MECVVLPCLILLRKLVYNDPAIRLSFANQPSVLLMLFRVSLIFQDHYAVLTETAGLLCLLLFDEVARKQMWSDAVSCQPPFSLP
uniref:Uncharacterized protein n=1 Tax=Sphenodon punctatus TaxID=8508 RepID=A0A8D0L745_SPHPU